MDTIGNCQRLASTVGVSQHMHKITNLWKFELNRSSKLRDNNERRKYHCHTKLCAFRWLISRPQVLNLRSRNQIRGKLLLSQKLWHFRRSRMMFYTINLSPLLVTKKGFMPITILSNYTCINLIFNAIFETKVTTLVWIIQKLKLKTGQGISLT